MCLSLCTVLIMLLCEALAAIFSEQEPTLDELKSSISETHDVGLIIGMCVCGALHGVSVVDSGSAHDVVCEVSVVQMHGEIEIHSCEVDNGAIEGKIERHSREDNESGEYGDNESDEHDVPCACGSSTESTA